MYQLTVPQRGMLADEDFQRMRDLVSRRRPMPRSSWQRARFRRD